MATMRTAVLADIHANLEALEACLAHARRQGVERFALLGDFVNYGADPVACLAIVRELADQGAAVRGNHDEAALGGLAADMNPVAREALYWTRAQLGPAERTFLDALPYTAELGGAQLVHASADDPPAWSYLTGALPAARCLAAAHRRVVFAGHLHQPQIYHDGGEAVRLFEPTPGVAIPLLPRRRWLVLAGSVGQPRDGDPAAAYVLHDEAAATVTFFRVTYDHAAAARKIVAAGLPETLAWRLSRGI